MEERREGTGEKEAEETGGQKSRRNKGEYGNGREVYDRQGHEDINFSKYVCKYDEYKRWMEGEKERITSLSSVRIDGTPTGTEKSDTTGMAGEKLEKLETSHRAAFKAIDHARRMCGMGMEDRAKETLTRCIWTSCLDGVVLV